MGEKPEVHQSSRTALLEIVQWSTNLPPWQRDALRRICQQEQMGEEDFSALTDLCLSRHAATKDHTGVGLKPVDTSHIPSDGAGRRIALQYIKKVAHVNALAEGQVLKFRERGLTLVHGGNGSGKSGYARILKRACRAREATAAILPNVYTPATGNAASATIGYSVDGVSDCTEWIDAKPAPEVLSAISVFDAACASVHVEGTNDVAYTPRALEVLAALANTCREVRQRLDTQRQSLQGAEPASLVSRRSRPHTQVGKLVASLSESTNVTIAEQLASVSEEELKRMEDLRSDLANDPVRQAQQSRLRKQRLLQTISKVETLDDTLNDEAADKLKQLVGDFIAKTEAARFAAIQLFSNEPLPHVGGEVWRSLWEAARNYSEREAYPEQPFPVTDDEARCVLCQQELQPGAASRLTRFEAFVRENAQNAADQAAGTFQAALNGIRGVSLTRQEQADAVGQLGQELGNLTIADELRRYCTIARWRRRQLLRANTPDQWPSLPPLPDPPTTRLQAVVAEVDNRIAELERSADVEARRALELELHELEDRVWLGSVIEDVRKDIQRRQHLNALHAAVGDTDTRNITTKSTELAQRLVTKALKDRFTEELPLLGIAGPQVELAQTASQYGVPKFRVSLVPSPSIQVGSVLSEGEHRCVALAAFLAELATTDDQSGIVFDDPVSSLDHDHRREVAKRLVKEALTRQVVVFTHDIVFLTFLAEHARLAGLDPLYQNVASGTNRTGFCQTDTPLHVRPVLDTLQGISIHISNVSHAYANGDMAKWWGEVKSVAENLRELWERAVEQALSPVFHRFDYKVDTRNLVKVAVLNDNDCQKMRKAYGRCSALAHSEPAPVSSSPPTPQQMQSEVDTLRDWMTSILQRQDAVRPI